MDGVEGSLISGSPSEFADRHDVHSLAVDRYHEDVRVEEQAPGLVRGGKDEKNVGAVTLSDAPSNFQTVAKVDALLEDTGLPVELNGRAIALFRVDGAYFAIDDHCPHQGAPLCDGVLIDRTVTCTWHGWRFSLEDGRWLDSPRIRIGTYPVRIVGDEIQVAVD
jgi:nitrite reductase (NADH) small subunit/3-phenylpropionate/trans-cinnamate dioxygenase ferredoxin subunit